MHQQSLFTAILSRAHHAPATLQVCLPSSFSVTSHSRASESSALLMEISIASADASSSPLSNFPSIYSLQALSSHTIKIREEGYRFFTVPGGDRVAVKVGVVEMGRGMIRRVRVGVFEEMRF